MLKAYKKFYLIIFVCVLTILPLIGCTKRPNNIINTDELSVMMGKNNNNTSYNQETIKVNNGVVIYRDHASTNTPTGYSEVSFKPVKPIDFGPSELHFAPKNVNPK